MRPLCKKNPKKNIKNKKIKKIIFVTWLIFFLYPLVISPISFDKTSNDIVDVHVIHKWQHLFNNSAKYLWHYRKSYTMTKNFDTRRGRSRRRPERWERSPPPEEGEIAPPATRRQAPPAAPVVFFCFWVVLFLFFCCFPPEGGGTFFSSLSLFLFLRQ